MFAEEEESCGEPQCEQPKPTNPRLNPTGPDDRDTLATLGESQPQGRDLSKSSCDCHSSSCGGCRKKRRAEDVAGSPAGLQGEINRPSGSFWYYKLTSDRTEKKSPQKILINRFEFDSSVLWFWLFIE